MIQTIEERNRLTEQVKQAVREVEPEAEIILYGSRAREDAGAESDWDFLILLNGPVDDKRTDKVRHRLYELEWACGEVIGSIVRSHQDWQTPVYRATPFYKIIQSEGIQI